MPGVIIPSPGTPPSSRYLMLNTAMNPVPNSATERTMLGNLNGGMGIKKSYRTMPDGSVTMLATKNGMPEITNSGT